MYYKGRSLEYRVKHLLEKHGWLVLRCAGSKPFDLVALKKGYPTVVIECKNTVKYDKRKIVEQKKKVLEHGGVFLLVDRKKWKILLRLDRYGYDPLSRILGCGGSLNQLKP